MEKAKDTEYILSLSYGKDSIACLEAIKQLNYPLDRIVHAEEVGQIKANKKFRWSQVITED